MRTSGTGTIKKIEHKGAATIVHLHDEDKQTLARRIELALDGAVPELAIGDKIQFYAVAGNTPHKDSKRVATEQASYEQGYVAARWRKGAVATFPEIRR